MITGDIFEATDKLGRKYTYRFVGINLDDKTGCGYICLSEITTNEPTNVEYSWFSERKIKII